MITLPIIRWGKPYQSLEQDEVIHFESGEPVARIHQANGGLLQRDMRKAQTARDALRKLDPDDLLERCAKAGELYVGATLPMGEASQSPDDFLHAQSASTGMPEHMLRANVEKNAFVLGKMREILESLTRGLPLSILQKGYGEEGRGVTVSYQPQSPVLGAVLPSNSPGVHTLWLPAIPLQLGLVLKPGAREPWTPYRIYSAFVEAGVPAEAFGLYPGAGADVGAALLSSCDRAMVFGDAKTVDQYRGNFRVQPHGPGFSKILLGNDVVDDWEEYLDVMVESIVSNGGRSCINASGVWASRHTQEVAAALAERLGPLEPRPMTDPEAQLPAFTIPAMAEGTFAMACDDARESGVTDMTATFGERLIKHERHAFLRPIILHADGPQRAACQKEYLFPFATVVRCPQAEMIQRMGPTLVCTAITGDAAFIDRLLAAVNIDRLNIGPLPTNRINWRQPHEGNLIEFLFRNRAVQIV